MKKIFALLLAAISVGVCYYCVHRTTQEARFDLAGTVNVPQRLLQLAQADNNACAIIVKNEADVPDSIRRELFRVAETIAMTDREMEEIALELQTLD